MFADRVRDLLRLEWGRLTSGVNHPTVARQVMAESNVTAGYFLLLTLANLIALSGLLTNSAPAIIGAMLISPLMGPILSFGFGFITGDVGSLRHSARKIGLSVALTVAVAGLASYLSPLQLATPEILSRTRPNLFDLLVAILAGTAGAGALCTKRSVLTIVPGVAIATAVIPPLSVCGYGLGTGQWGILWGGFFLFFTNFVAITLATCSVFFVFGFRPGEGTSISPKALRNRMLALLGLLALISVPLVLTLRTSVSEMRDRRTIRAVLQESLGDGRRANLSSLSHQILADGSLSVEAVLNTAEYRSQEEVSRAESALAKELGRPAILYLEQIKMFHGGVVPPSTPPARVRSPGEILSEACSDVLDVLARATAKLGGLIAPTEISASSITFTQGNPPMTIRLQLKRDLPLSPEEQQWMERFLSSEVEQPIVLEVELLPFLEPLVFSPGGTDLAPEHASSLLEAVRLFRAGAGAYLEIESKPESPRALRAARLRLDAAKRYLTEQGTIPADRIRGIVDKRAATQPQLVLRFIPDPEAGQPRDGVVRRTRD